MSINDLKSLKQIKFARIKPLLKEESIFSQDELVISSLNDSIKAKFKIKSTENVSSHGYDKFALELISSKPDGIYLDCGSGRRPDYLENVVNFEIVPYDTTDVLGVGENLPFKDNSFDGVLSLNVLEHVKDPFSCAKEISRVLKPGGKLYCVVPFLCPYHDFPDHYYNATHSGLENLFSEYLEIDKQDVIASGLPIFSLTWFLNSWAQGLSSPDRENFMNMKVSDLMADPITYLKMPFVKNLSRKKNLELAATTALWASKKECAKNNSAEQGKGFLEYRQEFYNQLSGTGLEIGAFEHPASLPSGCEVEYCDIISVEEAQKVFPEINHSKLAKIDHIVDVDKEGLNLFPSNKFDFVIINHVLEHLFDPIKAFQECLRILKPKGRLILSVPDKRFTFDRERPLTTIESIKSRMEREMPIPKIEDYRDMITYIHKDLIEASLEKQEEALKSFLNRREHLNIWDSESFANFIDYALQTNLNPPILVAKITGDENQFEFLGMWEKHSA
tara:strand:- start:2941 stop:4452 length:1512 start_codon:yes stop_codon:yes gene_type:complete